MSGIVAILTFSERVTEDSYAVRTSSLICEEKHTVGDILTWVENHKSNYSTPIRLELTKASDDPLKGTTI